MRNAMWVGGGITGMGEIPMLGVKEKGLAKVIRDIFRNGEQGFFYDPSDMGTLFQDSGLTPLTSAIQPVGAMLDKSKGLSEGLEVFNALDLSDGAGWTTSGTITERTTNQFTTSGIGGLAYRVTSGKSYKLSMKGHSTVPFSIRNTTSGASGFDTIPEGDFDIVAYPVAVLLNNIYLFFQLRAAGVFTLEHISLKEFPGNHAYQTKSAARPILQQVSIFGSDLGNANIWESSVSENPVTVLPDGRTRIVCQSNKYTRLAKTVAMQSGKYYEVEVDVEAEAIPVRISTLTSEFSTVGRIDFGTVAANTRKTLSARFYATDTSARIGGDIGINEGVGFTFGNITIKEIKGYHTDQSYIEYDGVDDKLITNLPAPLTNATVLRAIPNEGTEVKYNQTLPMLYEDSTNHSGLIAIDRALTRSEQLRLMTELDKKAGATSLETLTFKLFDNNQEGIVYDPNDLSTLYQDASGTIPVTAVGQPVGLILDKSKCLRLGPNIATVTTVIGTGIGGDEFKQTTITNAALPGKRYKVSYRVENYSGSGTVGFVGSAFGPGLLNPTSGYVVFYAVAQEDRLRMFTRSINNADFLDISIQEVYGNHAYQTTSASRPILRQNAVTGAYYLEFDGVDDHLLVTSMPTIQELSLAGAVVGKSSKINPIIARGVGHYPYVTGTSFTLQNGASLPLNNPEVFTVMYSAISGSIQGKIRTRSGEADALRSASGPFYSTTPILIGRFSVANVMAASINLYGLVGINKVFNNVEQDTFLTHYHNLLGVTLNV